MQLNALDITVSNVVQERGGDTHFVILEVDPSASLRIVARRSSMRFQYFSLPLHSLWIARYHCIIQEHVTSKEILVHTMSATRAQSWTVVRQGVECTINWASAKMLALEAILSLIYGVAHKYVVKKLYPHSLRVF